MYNMPSTWQNQNCDTVHDPGSVSADTFEGISSCYGNPIHDPDIDENLGAGTEQLEWECVELAMRYMLLTYGVPPYSANGKYVASEFHKLYPGGAYGLTYELNPTNGVAPQIGDIINFGLTKDNGVGHVAIVSAVNYSSPGNGQIQIFQQNYGYLLHGQYHAVTFPQFASYELYHFRETREDLEPLPTGFIMQASKAATYSVRYME